LPEQQRSSILLPVLLFLVTVATRLPFASKLLYHMDSVQFALALKHYDITVHQPHPPGYFLYVMLGRFLNLFIEDANTVFVSASIFFSGLTIVMLYYLAREIFDQPTGLLAAAVALTSPSLWFHGEVALTYIVEAFFSTLIAFFCWKTYKGEHKYIWISAIALGLAGGIRQNTTVFLFPLWLFSVRKISVKKIAEAVALLGVVCLLWFVPMVLLTGGWTSYREAFIELMIFNTGNVSVFNKGWTSFKIFSSTLFDFIMYGVGAGIFTLGLAAYSMLRHKKSLDMQTVKSKALFFFFWVMPALLFYLLIFIHPSNPGYILIFLPAFFMFSGVSIRYLAEEFGSMLQRPVLLSIALVVVCINAAFFFFSSYPVTYREIVNHDRDLGILLSNIKDADVSETAIFVRPYTFFGYRQIMYYLPEYPVYQVDVRVTPEGEKRQTFWGLHGETHVSAVIRLPGNIHGFLMPIIADDRDIEIKISGVSIRRLKNTRIYLASGPVSLVTEIYPALNISFPDARRSIALPKVISDHDTTKAPSL